MSRLWARLHVTGDEGGGRRPSMAVLGKARMVATGSCSTHCSTRLVALSS